MPTVRIEMLQGRSQETKQQVANEITEMMCRLLGAEPGHVYVMFDEWAGANWSVGGKFLSESASASTTTEPTQTSR